MTIFRATRYKVGTAAAAIVITTIGLVSVPQHGTGIASARVETALVQIDAVLAAEATALVLSAPEKDSAATTPIPAASTIQEAANAAELGIGQVLTDIGRAILNIIGFVIAPVWWLAMPVTYGLYLDIRRRQYQGSNYIPTVLDAAGWTVAPLALGYLILGFPVSNPAASTSDSTVGPVPAEGVEVLRPTSAPIAEPTARRHPRAKVFAPRAKTTVPLGAAATARADETAVDPGTDSPSAGRAKATTSKSDRQRGNRHEVMKAGTRN